jgi:SSS family solute:Na+ symporter
LATLFVTDQLIGPVEGSRWFPWLHTKLTLNYTYRGLWGTLIAVMVLFAVSSFTQKTDPAKLKHLTVNWNLRPEPFRGILDWRLQWAALSAITATLYWLVW